MLYFLSGDDSYSKNEYVNKLCEGKEVIEIDIEESDISQVMSMILSIDLFATPKAYVFNNVKSLSVKSHYTSKTDLALFEKIFKADEVIIIKSDKPINRGTKLARLLQEELNIKEFNMQMLDYDKAVGQYVIDNNIVIEDEALEMVKVNFPNNIFGATNDIAKIWEYTNHQAITKQDVEVAGQKILEHRIFDIYNYILLGDTKRAIKYLELLRQEGVNDSDIIIASLSYIKRMYETKVLASVGQSDFQISQSIGVHSFVVKQNRKVLRTTNEKRLEKIVKQVANADYLMKSGQVEPKLLVDQLVAV